MRLRPLVLLTVVVVVSPVHARSEIITIIRGAGDHPSKPPYARPEGRSSNLQCYANRSPAMCGQMPRDRLLQHCEGARLTVGEGKKAWEAIFPDALMRRAQAGHDEDWAVAMVPGGLEILFKDERRLRVRTWDELTPAEREATHATEDREPWHKVEETSEGLRYYVPFRDMRRVGSSMKMLRAFYVDLETGEVRRVERKGTGARALHVRLSEATTSRARLNAAAQLRDLAARKDALDDPELTPALAAASLHADHEVAEHAIWGLWRLGRDVKDAPPLHLIAALEQVRLSEGCKSADRDRALMHAAAPLPAVQKAHARALAKEEGCPAGVRQAALKLLEGDVKDEDRGWLQPIASSAKEKATATLAQERLAELDKGKVPALPVRQVSAVKPAKAALEGTEPIPLKALPLPEGVQAAPPPEAASCAAIPGGGAAAQLLLPVALGLIVRRKQRARVRPRRLDA